jgi:glucose-6-phosphate isomerase
MLKIDYRFVMNELLRAHGLDKGELDSSMDAATLVLSGLRERRSRGELGFATVFAEPKMAESCLKLARKYKSKIENVVILGIGGSALGPRALASALLPSPLLAKRSKAPRLFTCDNIDPEHLSDVFKIAFSSRSLFVAISKSGATPETGSQLLYVADRLKKIYGKNWNKHLVAVTDPERGILRSFAKKHNLESLSVPPKIGGRYSVLTPVGLFPAALLGINPKEMLQGAREIDRVVFDSDQRPNPAELLAGIYFAFSRKGRNMLVMMPYSSKLSDLAEWFAQLWAESLGKKLSLSGREVRAGTTPVRALGATDQHSQLQLYLEGPRDKLVTFLKIDNFREKMTIPKAAPGLEELGWLSGKSFAQLINVEQFATSSSLARSCQPSLTVSMPKIDAYHLAALFYLFEIVTVVTAGLFEINPFDQPAVELGKQYTAALMGRPGFEDKQKELEQFEQKADAFLWPKK